MKLLQVSDPHFGTERPEVVAGLLRLAHTLVPDVLLMSGDLTQRARRTQFAAARAFAEDALRRPPGGAEGVLLALPGNHDIPLFNLLGRALRPYAGFSDAFGPDRAPCWQDGAVQITTVDTTRPWRHIDGDISADQIDAVARRLRKATPRQVRVVACHHPLAVPGPGEAKNLVRNHEAALRHWADAGADLVLGGHIHLPTVLPMHERMPGLARRLWVVQAGTAVSHRTRHEAGNSVNVLRVPEAGAEVGEGAGTEATLRRCVVERWDWNAEAQRFEVAQRHVLAWPA